MIWGHSDLDLSPPECIQFINESKLTAVPNLKKLLKVLLRHCFHSGQHHGDLDPQNAVSSSLSPSGPMYQIWRNSLKAFFELSLSRNVRLQWPLTLDHQIQITSSLSQSGHLCQSEVCGISRSQEWHGRTYWQKSDKTENIVPPAMAEGRRWRQSGRDRLGCSTTHESNQNCYPVEKTPLYLCMGASWVAEKVYVWWRLFHFWRASACRDAKLRLTLFLRPGKRRLQLWKVLAEFSRISLSLLNNLTYIEKFF